MMKPYHPKSLEIGIGGYFGHSYKSNKPLSYTFAHQIRGLVYYHTETCTSAQDLLESARCDRFVNGLLVP